MSVTESQCKEILNYLKFGNTLTSLQSLSRFGCQRLSARVRDLRERGHDIKTEIITTRSQKRVARYSLEGGEV